MTSTNSSHLQSSHTTTMFTPPCSRHPFSLTLAIILRWALNHTSLHLESKQWMSSQTGWRTHLKRLSLCWPRQRMTWRSTTTNAKLLHPLSLLAIRSTSTPMTSRPLVHQWNSCTDTLVPTKSNALLDTLLTAWRFSTPWDGSTQSSMLLSWLLLHQTPLLDSTTTARTYWQWRRVRCGRNPGQ